jgi:hypothetical protein
MHRVSLLRPTMRTLRPVWTAPWAALGGWSATALATPRHRRFASMSAVPLAGAAPVAADCVRLTSVRAVDDAPESKGASIADADTGLVASVLRVLKSALSEIKKSLSDEDCRTLARAMVARRDIFSRAYKKLRVLASWKGAASDVPPVDGPHAVNALQTAVSADAAADAILCTLRLDVWNTSHTTFALRVMHAVHATAGAPQTLEFHLHETCGTLLTNKPQVYFDESGEKETRSHRCVVPYFNERRIVMGATALGTFNRRVVESPCVDLTSDSWERCLFSGKLVVLAGASGCGKTFAALLANSRKERRYIIYVADETFETQVQAAMAQASASSTATERDKDVKHARDEKVKKSLVDALCKTVAARDKQEFAGCDAGSQFVVVIDELGDAPLFLRGLCATIEDVQCEIAARFNLRDDALCIVAVGTGTGGTRATLGSFPGRIAVVRLQKILRPPRDVFRLLVQSHIAAAAAAAKHGDVAAHERGKVAAEEFFSAAERAIFDGSSVAALAAARLFGNARCAALIFAQLTSLQTVMDGAQARMETAHQAVSLALPNMVALACFKFKALSGLRVLGPDALERVLLETIAVSARPAWFYAALDNSSGSAVTQFRQLCVQAGLLTDSAAWMDDDAWRLISLAQVDLAEEPCLDKSAASRGATTRAAPRVRTSGAPRYVLHDPLLVLAQALLGSGPMPAVVGSGSGDPFELQVGDFLFLCVAMSKLSTTYLVPAPYPGALVDSVAVSAVTSDASTPPPPPPLRHFGVRRDEPQDPAASGFTLTRMQPPISASDAATAMHEREIDHWTLRCLLHTPRATKVLRLDNFPVPKFQLTDDAFIEAAIASGDTSTAAPKSARWLQPERVRCSVCDVNKQNSRTRSAANEQRPSARLQRPPPARRAVPAAAARRPVRRGQRARARRLRRPQRGGARVRDADGRARQGAAGRAAG